MSTENAAAFRMRVGHSPQNAERICATLGFRLYVAGLRELLSVNVIGPPPGRQTAPFDDLRGPKPAPCTPGLPRIGHFILRAILSARALFT